jgi:LmbE family N-acetylglucosaminyl deacetylase
MIGLLLPVSDRPQKVLCLGAHADDIEIGCGGTILELAHSRPELRFHWVVFSAKGVRAEEAARSATLFTEPCRCETQLFCFRDGFLPTQRAEVKEHFEHLKARIDPDLILTHFQDDGHQDHRLLAELAWNTFRDHLILEYEIPKYDGDLGRPSVYVPLAEEIMERKCSLLLDVFLSQRAKRWFSRELFQGLMRIRGMECNAPSGYAEAFHARKLVIHTWRG